jgi:hypothetical protein
MSIDTQQFANILLKHPAADFARQVKAAGNVPVVQEMTA